MRNISFIIFLLISLTACEKVIDIDLNESDPQIVIEASLEAGEHEFVVRITETTSYFDNQLPNVIDYAQIRLFQEDGTAIEIPYQDAGNYAALVNAMPNQTYRLEVEIGDLLYEASSFLPEKVELLQLETEFQEARGPIEEGYLLYFSFKDDGSVDNYYRLLHSIDGVFQNGGDDLQVSDDAFVNGGVARLPLFRKTFNSGEEIEVELRHFDAASFEYFNSLSDIVSNEEGGPGGGSAA
ncbi:MAG: DUF4249 domain-containing protein, partial [Bacteroidota bacterium]